MNPREDDPEFAERRPTFDDLRADYDDDFGRKLSPFEVARRRLFFPGVAHIVIGSIAVAASVVAAGITLYTYVDDGLDDWDDVLELLGFEALIALGTAVFLFVIAGGVAMMRLRRRWLCFFAAYAVTGLSVAGCYAILFYPFGIWALVVLYRSDVREQFGRRPAAPERDARDW